MEKKKYFAEECRIEKDDEYFRVIIRLGTHKLHSEKLNIETASALWYELISGIKS